MISIMFNKLLEGRYIALNYKSGTGRLVSEDSSNDRSRLHPFYQFIRSPLFCMESKWFFSLCLTKAVEELKSEFSVDPGIIIPFLQGEQGLNMCFLTSFHIFEALKAKFCCKTFNLTRGTASVNLSFLGRKVIISRVDIGVENLRT